MNPAQRGSRRAVLRITAELLDRTGRISAHLQRLENVRHATFSPVIQAMQSALEKHEEDLRDFVQPHDAQKQVNDAETYTPLQEHAKLFLLAHEFLSVFPAPLASPEILDVLNSTGFTAADRSSVVLGTLFNAYELNFADHLIAHVPHDLELRDQFQKNPFFQLAVCDNDAPTAWGILAHEVGHAYDRQNGICKRVSEEFCRTLKTSAADDERTIRGLTNELWADLVGAHLLGPTPILALASMEYCVLPWYIYQWKSPPRLQAVHPPLAWRLRVVRDYLGSNARFDKLLSEEQEIWNEAVAYHASISDRNAVAVTADEADYERWVTPIVESLKGELRLSSLQSPLWHDQSIKRCVDRLNDWLPVPAQGLRRDDLRGAIVAYAEQANRSAGEFRKLTEKFRELPISPPTVLLSAHAVRQQRIGAAISLPAWSHEQSDELTDDLAHIEALAEISLIGAAVHRVLLEKMELRPELPEATPCAVPPAPRFAGHEQSLLCDIEILDRVIAPGALLLFVSPLVDQRQIGPSSLDVRLGTEIYVTRPMGATHINLAGSGVEAQRDVQHYYTRQRVPADGTFVLHPGQFALGTTLEYIRLPIDVAARLEGRSTPARLGIQVHATAGFIDPGFEGTLTFELSNAGNVPVKIAPGYRLGQLCFFRVRNVQVPYREKDRPKYSRAIGVRLPALRAEPELVEWPRRAVALS